MNRQQRKEYRMLKRQQNEPTEMILSRKYDELGNKLARTRNTKSFHEILAAHWAKKEALIIRDMSAIDLALSKIREPIASEDPGADPAYFEGGPCK